MQQPEKKVGPLHKVVLDMRATACTDAPSTGATHAEAVIIYGIGTAGATPFEHLLAGKAVGDEISLRIAPGKGQTLFGHLQCTMLQALTVEPPFDLVVTVRSTAPAENREVVQAMARLGGCGDGCGCGCGG